MSVMAQLKKFSSDPSEDGGFNKQFTPDAEGMNRNSEMEEIMQDQPIPGQSLTQDPDQKLPFERPAEFTDQPEYLEALFMDLTEENKLPTLLQALRKGVPVEQVALKALRADMRKGKINVDLLMLCIEPVIYMMIALGTYAEIDVVLAPDVEEDEEGARSEMAMRFRQAARELTGEATNGDSDGDGKLTIADVQSPPSIPKSLLPRAEAAVQAAGSSQEAPLEGTEEDG